MLLEEAVRGLCCEDRCFGFATVILRNIPVWKLTHWIALDRKKQGHWQCLCTDSNVLFGGQNT